LAEGSLVPRIGSDREKDLTGIWPWLAAMALRARPRRRIGASSTVAQAPRLAASRLISTLGGQLRNSQRRGADPLDCVDCVWTRVFAAGLRCLGLMDGE